MGLIRAKASSAQSLSAARILPFRPHVLAKAKSMHFLGFMALKDIPKGSAR
jgi:hypothetical protein